MIVARRTSVILRLLLIASVGYIFVASLFFMNCKINFGADDMGRGPLEWRRRTFRQSAASLLDRGTVPLEKFQMNTQSDEPGTHKDRSGVTRHAGANICPSKEIFASERVNKMGSYPVRKTFLTIGIATIMRPQKNYLLQTLQNIMESFTEEDKKNVSVVVFLADFNETTKNRRRKALVERFQRDISEQIMHVIEAPKEFYPSLDGLKNKYYDSPERVRWRSKQNIDYAFLMCYCRGLSSFYLHLEDDIKVSPSFLPKLRDFIGAQTESWEILDASAQGHVGKVYHSEDLVSAASLFYIMYDEMPVDWLMMHWRQMTSGSLDPAGAVFHTAGLFDHLGTLSSLGGKKVKSTERYFDKYDHKYLGLNPAAEVTSTIEAHVGQPQDAYNKGIGYFWAKNAKRNDNIRIVFRTPVYIKEVSVETGSYLAPGNILRYADLEISTVMGRCRIFRTVGRLERGNIHVQVYETAVCLRVLVASSHRSVFVREINVWTK